MNSENSKTSDPYRPLFNLADKINSRRSEKYVALSYYLKICIEKHKKSHKNNKFKISTSTSNDKFELLDGSYSV